MTWFEHNRQLQAPQGETFPFDIRHNSTCLEEAFIEDDGRLCLRISAEAGVINTGEVVYRHNSELVQVPLNCVHQDEHLTFWETHLTPPAFPLHYYFRLSTTTGQALLGATGLQASLPSAVWFCLEEAPNVNVPTWARGIVFYQIFPDRFARGSDALPADEPWGDEPTSTGFKGGNLSGITDRLDYLFDLGINAIWLNPVFKSPSNHRYDTTDFYSIDERLGSTEDLCKLVEQAHERGMRVILDGVFNHISEAHPFFIDVKEKGKASPYWSWFTVRRWPFQSRGDEDYATWWGHGHLPQLKMEHPDVRAYFIEVGTYWLEHTGIDGWRIDVAGEIPVSFWRHFRQAIKSVNPEAYLVAEVWGDARAYTQGDSFDATMHYPFRRAVLAFLRDELDATRCASYLNRLYYRLPRQVAEVQYNLLGSHDVSRIQHELGGDHQHVKMAMALQAAYPGVKALYYGDELGLPGEGDPDCRRSFPDVVGLQANTLYTYVRELSKMQRDHPALRLGEFKCYAEGKNRLVVERRLLQDSITLKLDRTGATITWT